ncbi:thermonuclease family protein [Pelagicoccus mobilis]|uniref:Thermonuclease family protein n=1 Tax=Pelagicoccus mobilis TaxID=415221 RepID=A0A934RYS9_9BACT|nr:thermonuclease family protein [Pelagicoccus mobilis]MBK1876003.1 thermonuclease family protein [Pelagicoccus mobilis]
MPKPAIFWDPAGLELDSLGSNSYLRSTDGDTPYVSLSIRMLSVDTPETHYPGRSKPARSDEKLAELASWIQEGAAPIDDGLAAHLQPKLETGRAGTLHGEQGEAAHEHFERLVEEKLTKPSGRKRRVYLKSGNEPFDRYGRLLAYMAPNYTRAERDEMTPLESASFNLLMVASGWAASFIIFPSLPKHSDLCLFQEEGRKAVEDGLGAWSDPLTLTGYEFRMCVKLHTVTKELMQGKKLSKAERLRWIDRYCCDMSTRGVYSPQDYYRVPAYDRIFIWKKDVNEAVARLNLSPEV